MRKIALISLALVASAGSALAQVTLTPATLPAGSQGVAYSRTVTASGGTPNYTYAIIAGALPAGLTLTAASGVIAGTPTGSGISNFTVRATDAVGSIGTQAYSVNIGTNILLVSPVTLANGTQGVAYSQTVSASGGTAPYTFAVTTGTLPVGLVLDAATGAITGTPTAAANANFTIRATDALGNTGSQAYSVNIGGNTLVLAPATLSNGTQGVAYYQAVSATGGVGAPYTYAITSGALPTGLALNGGTGEITGMPTVQGTFNFTMRATDPSGNGGSRAYTVNIGGNTLVVSPATLANGTQGVAYSQTVTASGGTAPYTYALATGTLPNGLVLDANTGAISGLPTTVANSNFSIRATDVTGNTGVQAYSVNIGGNTLVLTPATLANGTQGVAYFQTVSASGGAGAPYTYAVTSGALPAGLALNAGTGEITGTPTAGGIANFTIRATDAIGTGGSRAYSVNIGSSVLTVSPATLANGTQGVAYSQTIGASGGTGPYTYGVVTGALPAGLTLNAGTGAITGTPTGTGTSNFTIRATDAVGNNGSQAYAVNIGGNTLVVSPATLANGTQGVAYNQTVSASGGTAPYTYAVSTGTLPVGLTLNSGTGAITGTPTGTGTSNFTIQAFDAVGNGGSRAYSVNIGGNTLVLTPATLANGTQGVAYYQTVSASGGVGAPYTYTVTSGALPVGVTLNAGTGEISGTPTGSGTFNFTIRATDAVGTGGSRAYAVNIGTSGLTVAPATLANGTQGVAYSQTVSASGGTAPYSYAVMTGALPSGLTLNAATGAITGTPNGSGMSNFTVRATDAIGNTGSQAYAVNIGSNTLTVSPATLANGTQGVAYSQTVSASGGTAPYTYALSAGTLPVGLTLDAGTGAITGTPTAVGNSNFTIRATDAVGDIGTQAYSVNIGGNTLVLTPTTLPNGAPGVPYSQTVSATGGVGAPYTYAITSGALPTGLTLNAGSGVISGTPTVAGPFNFTVRATDAVGTGGSRAYAVNIGTSVLTVSPATLANGTQGVAYSQTVSASGGAAPYTYAVTAGTLPNGLTLDANSGAITGTPTTVAVSNFTIRATDTLGNTGSQDYSVNIGGSTLVVTPATLPNGTQGTAYFQVVSATGGTAPYTYAVTSGSLPAGLTLNSGSGAITGTPTAGGTSNFTIQATDAVGTGGSRAYSVTISSGTTTVTINPATLPGSTVGQPYSQTLVAGGGTGPYTYVVTAGALPPGLTLVGGTISGTPTSASTSAFTIVATDSLGNSGNRAYSLLSRPDPALDAEVIGLVNAQVAVARRFATTQIENVSRHLESLHSHFEPCSVALDLNLPPAAVSKGMPDMIPPPNSPAAEVARRMPRPQECAANGGWMSSVAAWVSGSVQFGTGAPDSVNAQNRFSTAGLTAGIDWRATSNLIVGAAVGYGADRSNIGSNITRSDATSISGTVYASFRPFDAWFIDAVVGYGQLYFDNRRWIASDPVTATGTRTGGYWFGAVTTSYEFRSGALRMAPYLRGDFMSGTLNSYTEQGSGGSALTFGSMNFSTSAGTVGLRGSYDIPIGWGVFTPTARIEYGRAFNGAFQQSMYYADLGPTAASTLNQASATRDLIGANFGFRARSFGGVTTEFEYGATSASGAFRGQTIRGSLRVPF